MNIIDKIATRVTVKTPSGASPIEPVVMCLSYDAAETAKEMIRYCIENNLCIGIDDGFSDIEKGERHEFVKELINIINT